MKKFFTTSLFLCYICFQSFGQVPSTLNYQAVARDATGKPLANTSITVQISILASTTGAALYTETFTVSTNAKGLFTLAIGSGKAPGLLQDAIRSTNGSSYLQVVINGALVGTSQLLSVPYSFYSASSGNLNPIIGNTLDISFVNDNLSGTNYTSVFSISSATLKTSVWDKQVKGLIYKNGQIVDWIKADINSFINPSFTVTSNNFNQGDNVKFVIYLNSTNGLYTWTYQKNINISLPTCTDMIKNGTETDIDCGGSTCPPCSINKVCSTASDCASGLCNNGKCATNLCPATLPANTQSCDPATGTIICNVGFGDCNRNIQDGCEVSLNSNRNYCGNCNVSCSIFQTCVNGTCIQPLPNGSACTSNSSCISGKCVGGVCVP